MNEKFLAQRKDDYLEVESIELREFYLACQKSNNELNAYWLEKLTKIENSEKSMSENSIIFESLLILKAYIQNNDKYPNEIPKSEDIIILTDQSLKELIIIIDKSLNFLAEGNAIIINSLLERMQKNEKLLDVDYIGFFIAEIAKSMIGEEKTSQGLVELISVFCENNGNLILAFKADNSYKISIEKSFENYSVTLFLEDEKDQIIYKYYYDNIYPAFFHTLANMDMLGNLVYEATDINYDMLVEIGMWLNMNARTMKLN